MTHFDLEGPSTSNMYVIAHALNVAIDFINFNECMPMSNIIDQCCEFLSQDQWYQEHFIMLLNSLTKAQDNKKNFKNPKKKKGNIAKGKRPKILNRRKMKENFEKKR
jgi:hypothetical protein